MSPPVGVSSPAMRFKSVVLPEPDGPMRARNSPAGTSRDSFWRTRISSLPRTNDLYNSRTRTWARRSGGMAVSRRAEPRQRPDNDQQHRAADAAPLANYFFGTIDLPESSSSFFRTCALYSGVTMSLPNVTVTPISGR